VVFLVEFKFFVFVSDVVSIFSEILSHPDFLGANGYLCPPNLIIGGRAPGLLLKVYAYGHISFSDGYLRHHRYYKLDLIQPVLI